MYIYLASSWRNEYQEKVVQMLRENKYSVYDFKNPNGQDRGFNWSDIDKNWKYWNYEEFTQALKHRIAVEGYNRDMHSLIISDVVILLMPCGRSAHLELGYAVGKEKKTAILLFGEDEPELMYNMVSRLFSNMSDMFKWLEEIKSKIK